jgi:MoaA/NifB/PqqE/SkfB family radical SAM enzyme
MNGRKHISWDIHFGCSYACPYCFLRERTAPEPPPIPAGDWLAAWERFHKRWGPALIDISGGEPFEYPGFPGLLAAVSGLHEVRVITNFSWDPSILPPGVNPARASFVLSMHPRHLDNPGAFLDKALVLKNRGFRVRATAVAYPPFLRTALEYGALCARAGLKFTLTPFFGDFEGRQYPAAYTVEEKETLRGLIPGQLAPWQLLEVNPAGRPCRAGADYARVSPDGTARPCLHSPPLGNFLSDDFNFRNEPAPCPSAYCHCMLESAYCGPAPAGPAAA